MSATSTYERTMLRAVHIEGYRSIKELHLTELPSLIVLHGLNGSGKSNLLRAIALGLRWATQTIASTSRSETSLLDAKTVHASYGVLPHDFHRGVSEIRIALSLSIGTQAQSALRSPLPVRQLDFAFVLQDVGDESYRFWCERAVLDNDVDLLEQGSTEEQQLRLQIAGQRLRVQSMRQTVGPKVVTPSTPQLRADEDKLKALEEKMEQLGKAALLRERIGRQLLASTLLGVCDAYRTVSAETLQSEKEELSSFDPSTLQQLIYQWNSSQNTERRQRVRALARHLEQWGLHGPSGQQLELTPIADRVFGKYRVHLTNQSGADIPLDSLGSGEQQLFLMVAQLFLEGRPVFQIEEPEAHLHHEMMKSFSRQLLRAVQPPGGEKPLIDQLWIATHHHHFALAEEFFDVTFDRENGTQLTKQPRAKAAKHFYEPGPLWDVFRSLATTLTADTVVFLDRSGNPVTAAALSSAVEEEAPIAKEWAQSLTEYIVLSMRKRDERRAESAAAKP